MRNGGIGIGWYEDDPNADQLTEHEIELKEFFTGMLKDKLIEVFELIAQRHKERRDAAKEVKVKKSFFE